MDLAEAIFGLDDASKSATPAKPQSEGPKSEHEAAISSQGATMDAQGQRSDPDLPEERKRPAEPQPDPPARNAQKSVGAQDAAEAASRSTGESVDKSAQSREKDSAGNRVISAVSAQSQHDIRAKPAARHDPLTHSLPGHAVKAKAEPAGLHDQPPQTHSETSQDRSLEAERKLQDEPSSKRESGKAQRPDASAASEAPPIKPETPFGTASAGKRGIAADHVQQKPQADESLPIEMKDSPDSAAAIVSTALTGSSQPVSPLSSIGDDNEEAQTAKTIATALSGHQAQAAASENDAPAGSGDAVSLEKIAEQPSEMHEQGEDDGKAKPQTPSAKLSPRSAAGDAEGNAHADKELEA